MTVGTQYLVVFFPGTVMTQACRAAVLTTVLSSTVVTFITLVTPYDENMIIDEEAQILGFQETIKIKMTKQKTDCVDSQYVNSKNPAKFVSKSK